jgi:hypothetical protein
MIELDCPNCGHEVTLNPSDETDETSSFNGECEGCNADLTLLMRIHEAV